MFRCVQVAAANTAGYGFNEHLSFLWDWFVYLNLAQCSALHRYGFQGN